MLPSSILVKCFNSGIAAVISPVSVANKVKSDDFDFSVDPDLNCDLSNIFLFKFPLKVPV